MRENSRRSRSGRPSGLPHQGKNRNRHHDESNWSTRNTASGTARRCPTSPFMNPPYYHKLFASTDGALLTYPTLEQKKGEIENTVKVFHKLGIDIPKVAVLAAVDSVNPKMKESVEAAALKTMWQEGKITGCTVEGPISYDIALSAEAAEIKGFSSPVAGGRRYSCPPGHHVRKPPAQGAVRHRRCQICRDGHRRQGACGHHLALYAHAGQIPVDHP